MTFVGGEILIPVINLENTTLCCGSDHVLYATHWR